MNMQSFSMSHTHSSTSPRDPMEGHRKEAVRAILNRSWKRKELESTSVYTDKGQTMNNFTFWKG